MNTNTLQAPLNGFMLAAGYKPKSKVVKPAKANVKSYGYKSDLIIEFVQDKPATIADIALHFDWTKTSTSSLVSKIEREHKVIKLDLQVMNGRSFTIVRGINLVAEYKVGGKDA